MNLSAIGASGGGGGGPDGATGAVGVTGLAAADGGGAGGPFALNRNRFRSAEAGLGRAAVFGDRLVEVAGAHRRLALAVGLAGGTAAGGERQDQHPNLHSAI